MAYPTKITIDGKNYPVKKDSIGSYIEYKRNQQTSVTKYNIIITKRQGGMSEKDKTYLITNSEFILAINDGETNFSNRVFIDKVNFKDFPRDNINFENSIFIAEVDCTDAQFQGIANFNHTEFTKQATFSNAQFQEAQFIYTKFNEADFDEARFQDKAYFNHAEFTNQATFSNAQFREAQFVNTKFNKAKFDEAEFQNRASFIKVQFHDIANFYSAQFQNTALFPYAKFHNESDFSYAKFHDIANFNGAEFQNIAYFSYTLFNESFDLTEVNKAKENKKIKPLQLSLERANVQKIFYSGAEITGIKRETCNILKNAAIKQNDQIIALDFHTQEYAKHYDELEWNKNPLNKSLLTIEKYCSKFGTNWLMPIGWLLFFTFLFTSITECKEVYFSFPLISCPQEFLAEFLPEFLPKFLAEFFQNLWLIPYSKDILEGASWGYLSFFTLYKVLSIFLLYEIIKSFRKYSRKI